MPTRLLVAQSGGPTAVINASLLGVIEAALDQPTISDVYGAVDGVEGLLESRVIDLGREDRAALRALRQTPAAALGSCRYKLQPEDPERLLACLDQLAVGFLVYIGGNDSADTAHRLAEHASASGRSLRVVVVPKTIDNDLPITDHCPGYGSIARYVAVGLQDVGRDTEAMHRVDKVKIVEVMGRNAGWVVAASALGKRDPLDPPHLLYPPERRLAEDTFLAEVEAVYRRVGHVVVVVAETVRGTNGELIGAGDRAVMDSFGHSRLVEPSRRLTALVETRLGLRARYDRPGTFQRMSTLHLSPVDVAEAYEAGRRAVAALIAGETDKMVTLLRPEGPYHCEYGLAPLAEIANHEKLLPAEYTPTPDAFPTPAFRAYAEPLLGGPLPEHARLKRYYVSLSG
ncbi:MAG TPA: diphosphate--fructose-6-phosphate 1-phosphotransferase [Chloroflexota bacterium]|nr:diphosphate--fructose-6-phosphate 1-phosphotransferase [Chloroflexota bacterium]